MEKYSILYVSSDVHKDSIEIANEGLGVAAFARE